MGVNSLPKTVTRQLTKLKSIYVDFNFCVTSVGTQLLDGCSAGDILPFTPTPSLVRYANRLFGHRRRFTKRLTVETLLTVADDGQLF